MSHNEITENKKAESCKDLADKVFIRSLTTSIFAVVICMIFLTSSTLAWFNTSVQSQSNSIKAADECLISVTVNGENVDLSLSGDGKQTTADLEAGKEYTVTLSLPENSASGYCVITAQNGTKYYSDYISRHSETLRTVQFILTVAESQTLTFTTHWGIYNGESSVQGGRLAID